MSRGTLLLAVLVVVPVIVCASAVWAFDHSNAHTSLFGLSNLVGPVAESLLRGNGLAACTEAMGTPNNSICFHAGRMPLPSMVVALGVRLLGDRYLAVAFFKALLLLLPLEAAICLVWLRMPRSGLRRLGMAALLLAPFAMTAMLANAVNLQVEEGYSYSLLALALAILFFSRWSSEDGWGRTLLFAVAADGVYLAKSSMAPAVVVLLAGFLWMERRTAQRLVVVMLIAAAPIGWALHQHHASGRYSVGTSVDGINLHKGNNAEFLARYPPPPGESLDRYDAELNRGLHFDDEWSFNDYHEKAAFAFLRAHPRETLEGDVRKLEVLFFSVRKNGSTESHGVMRVAETGGLVLFRLMLWAAILGAAYVLVRSPSGGLRAAGGIFLALVGACALPYVVGFAYTRHVSILIYPAALMCCRMLSENTV
jgi:hypothetical protein